MRFVENEDGTREFFCKDSDYYAYIIEKSFCKSDPKLMFDLIQVLHPITESILSSLSL